MSAAEYLEDAELIAGYGVRAGLLAEDEPLFSAIATAAAAPHLDWSSVELVELQRTIGLAIKKIRPVTLRDLKSGWRPDLDGVSLKKRKSTRNLVILFTCVTLFFTGYLTIWQQKAITIVASFDVNVDQRIDEAYAQLFLVMTSIDQGKRESLLDVSSASSLAFADANREIERLERSIWAFRSSLLGIERDLHSPIRNLASIVTTVRQWAWGSPANAEVNAAGIVSNGVDDSVCFYGSVGERYDRLADSIARESTKWDDLYVDFITYRQGIIDRIRCDTGILNIKDSYVAKGIVVPVDLLDSIKYAMATMSTWLLPMLYGILGSLIYNMRVYLNYERPDPKFYQVVVRVVLGGFAGIAIGWFWLPSGEGQWSIQNVSVTPLTLAFLVGYSIETFLTLLDRLVLLTSQRIAGIGEATS